MCILGIVDISTKRSLVESFNKMKRYEEELEIIKRECRHMLEYYQQKIHNLSYIYEESEGDKLNWYMKQEYFIE